MKKVLTLGLVMVLMMGVASFAAEEAKPVAEYTFMCFLNADNNLDPFGIQDMNEMKKIGSTDKFNIIVLIDREKGPAKLLRIEKGKEVLLKEMGEIDMGDYKQMVSFVKFCKENYPAKHYILDIWNHGAGWKARNGEKVIKGISYDYLTGNNITTAQLKTACAEIAKVLGQKLDVMSHDACLMGMLEICAEQYESCNYFLCSEETEPGDGYAYDLMLGPIVKNPTMSVVDACKTMVKGFGQYYANESGTTTACLDMSKIKNILAKTDALAVALVAGLKTTENKAAMKAVMVAVQKFYYRDNIDLIHLCQLLQQKINDAGIKASASALEAAVKASVVVNFNHGYNMKNAFGMAIYLPTGNMSSAYTAISLGKTKWVDAIKAVNSCYKALEEPANFAYNLEYPQIVAEGIALETKGGDFTNFDKLLTITTDAAIVAKSELKKKIGTEILNGSDQLKSKMDLLLE